MCYDGSMQNERDVESAQFIFRTAAWMWLGYLALLLTTDIVLSGRPGFGLDRYYLINGALALLFLACALWTSLHARLEKLHTPLMLVLIAALPLVVNRLWIGPLPPGPLPPGPMSNVEGMTLRLLPVLLIGLIVTAWHYPWPVVALYALLTTGLDIAMQAMLPAARDVNAMGIGVFVVMVRLVAFLVVGYFISRLIQRLQDQQRQLAQTNARLVHYASALEQLTLSRERNRLARELHDTLAHSLSALSVQLETVKAYWEVEPETARSLLDQSLTATRTGLNETRRALKALRASPLDDLGLLLALDRLARNAAERGRLVLQLTLPDTIPPLTAAVEQCIYRVDQEALENVVRHANARQLQMILAAGGPGVTLSIADDGVGFNPAAGETNGHFGLAGMRERAALAGASLTVESQPQGGTRIQLTIQEPSDADSGIDM